MISFAHGHAVSYLKQLLKLSNVLVTGIADVKFERVQHYVNQYGIAYYSDPMELLKTDVDAVIICSENAYHAQWTIAAAIAGKHVLCEKPLGISIDEMNEMISACKSRKVQLMTAFPCRYFPAVKEAREAVQHGEIGEILAIKGTNRGRMPGDWFVDRALSGGGAILDHTVHVTDLICWFLQDTPVEVFAVGGTLFHDIDIDDAGMVHMKFANGIVAVLDPSWSRPTAFPTWGDVTMEIVGTEGVIYIDAFAQKLDIYSNEVMKTEWNYWGDNTDEYLIKDFIHSLMNDIPVPITGEDGKHAAAVAIAAYESVKSQLPVRLNVLLNR
jgi:predicted dehydrogenase